ncbi:unnamed protein product [Miscanthus lutarioriparius]|uniref:Phytocyanin domain-containing protein n=1 Tax=Miscanthus lutarioriparius TaxID=422564 RepID=A0A811RZ99_9POAL|nr:unnamed protein product [Miscanthus lutarioriparius]
MAMQALAVASLLLILWPARSAGAAEYVVGDVSYGWESGSGINYAAWARQHAFAVGDVLVFQYVSSQHNLYEVTEEVYRSCDTAVGGGNGVRVKYTSGYDRVVLAEARGYWFICDFPGHCLGGMRVAVNNSAGAAGGGGSGGSPTVNPPPDGSAASSITGGRPGWAAGCLALVVLALMNTKGLLLLL